MEGSEKPFSTVDIVILVMLALINDAVTLVGDLSLLIPYVGPVIGGFSELLSAVVWAIVMFWFILKLGFFGAPGLVQTAGGVVEFFGIPGRTATVIIGVVIANHPKLAAAAAVAGGKAGATKAAGTAEKEAAELGSEAKAASTAGKSVSAETSAQAGLAAEKEGAATQRGAGVRGESPIDEIKESMERIPEPEEGPKEPEEEFQEPQNDAGEDEEFKLAA